MPTKDLMQRKIHPILFRSMKDAARTYGVSRTTLYRLISRGRLDARRLPGVDRVLLTQASLDKCFSDEKLEKVTVSDAVV